MPPKAKAKTASGGAKPKKKANGYKFPEKLPKGEVLVDSSKKQWVLGESIGQGGFGEIYCASEPGLGNKWPYVIKIEPHENGPLFMEKNFYIKVAKPDDVKSWKQKEGMKNLGIPFYLGSGTHHYKDEKYRFLVIDRFGKDLWSLFLKSMAFPPDTVYKIALQIIDTLRYIHSKDYVHGDIKGQNILLGLAPGTENQVFLVDFGLACKYSQKEFQRDPKQAHNGTIEYTSCDWHMGVPTRRGDLEILGYNLLHWLGGTLPWEKDLSKCEVVHKKKRELMDNVETFIASKFSDIPKVITEYMVYVSKLKHDEEPNYKYIKDLFTKELKKIGSSVTGPLEFEVGKSAAAGAARTPQKAGAAAKKVVANDGNQGKRSTPKRGATAKALAESSDDEIDEAPQPKVPAKRGAAAKALVGSSDEAPQPKVPAKRGAAAKALVESSDDEMDESPQPKVRAKRAAAAKPVIELSDHEEDVVTAPKVPANRKAAVKPKLASTAAAGAKPRTARRAAAENPQTAALSDDDIFASESSENEEPVPKTSSKAKTTVPKKKAASSSDSKPPRGTKRIVSKSSTNGSPSKRTKAAPKKTKAPAPSKKLDYRDAPKCLLPGIREEN